MKRFIGSTFLKSIFIGLLALVIVGVSQKAARAAEVTISGSTTGSITAVPQLTFTGNASFTGTTALGIGSLSGLVVAQAVGYVRQLVLGFFHCLRVVGANVCTLGQEALHNIQSRSKTDVIGVWLEGQTPDRKGLATQNPKLFLYLGYELLRTSKVDFLHLLQQREVAPKLFPDADESLKILGEAKSAEADAGIEKTLADTSVAAGTSAA